MKTNESTEKIISNAPWLNPWQRKILILAGALAGAVAATLVLRWLEARRNARIASAEQNETTGKL